MKEYVRKMIEDFPYPKEIMTKIQTPAANHLFKTRDCPKLPKDKAETFHTWVAKGFFYAKEQD